MGFREGFRKICHVNTNQKITGEVILISEKANLRTRKMIRHEEWHYIMMKGQLFKKT